MDLFVVFILIEFVVVVRTVAAPADVTAEATTAASDVTTTDTQTLTQPTAPAAPLVVSTYFNLISINILYVTI